MDGPRFRAHLWTIDDSEPPTPWVWSQSTLPLLEVKARLSEIADDADRTHERVPGTRNGRDFVVLLSAEDLASLEATREPLADHDVIIGPLALSPRRIAAPLRAPFEGLWRARRGEYRVRYRIDEEARRVVLDIDHRRDASRS